MRYSQFKVVFGTLMTKVSDDEFVVCYEGYNIKGMLFGSLPMVNFTFYAAFPDDPSNDIAQFGTYLKEKYGEIPTSYNHGFLSLLLDYNEKEPDDVRAIVNDAIYFLKQRNAQPCEIPVQDANSGKNNGAKYANRNTGAMKNHENYALGIIGALAGAALGMIVWIIISSLGFISMIGGICIAGGAMFGYFILSGDMSRTGIVISTVLIILGVVAADYISMGIAVMQVLDSGFIEAIGKVSVFLRFSEIRGTFIKDLVLGCLFALGAESMLYLKYFK